MSLDKPCKVCGRIYGDGAFYMDGYEPACSSTCGAYNTVVKKIAGLIKQNFKPQSSSNRSVIVDTNPHPEDHCQRCQRRMRFNYSADSGIWNMVCRNKLEIIWSIICIDCFIELCQAKGVEPKFVAFHIPDSKFHINIPELQHRPALEAGMRGTLRVESTTHWSPDCGWNLNDGTFYVPWHRSCVIKFAQSLGLTAEFVEESDE